MKITSVGLFWRKNEINWNPGQGNRNTFRLLGRIGTNKGKLKIADFRRQQGIYILHDNYGPYYVGLTRRLGLGERIKHHLSDRHYERWDRFSWFGFNELADQDTYGLIKLAPLAEEISESSGTTIGQLEALLIAAIGPKANRAAMKFKHAEIWKQISKDEVASYLAKISPRQKAEILGESDLISDG